MGFRQLIRSVFLFVVILSCVEPIDFKTEGSTPEIVFWGQLTSASQQAEFLIRRTTNFGQQQFPVEGAQVVLFDDLGNTEVYTEVEPGKYVIEALTIPVVPGRSYHVEIELLGGSRFNSMPQVMPEPIPIEDVTAKLNFYDQLSTDGIVVKRPLIDISVSTPTKSVSGEQAYLRWWVNEAYSFVSQACSPLANPLICYIVLPNYSFSATSFHSENPQTESIEDFKVFSRPPTPNAEFNFRHYFNVHQYAVSEETFEFWQRVSSVSNPSGSIFDVPPARLPGNIFSEGDPSQAALGFFEVSGESIGRVFTLPSDLEGIPVDEICPVYIPPWRRDPECCNCLAIPTATLNEPNYWGE